ncbi:MAG: two-component system sensor histidine kinase NtrB [Thermogutta sp.]
MADESEWTAVLDACLPSSSGAPVGVRRDTGPPISAADLADVRVRQLLNELAALKASHAEAVATAIAEREARLSEREEHLRQIHALLRQAADAILTLDNDAVIRSANDAAERMFGRPERDLAGKSLDEVMEYQSVQSRSEVLKLIERAASGHTPIEVAVRCADGRILPAEMALSRVVVNDESRFFASFRDISERKMLEAKVRQAQKMESIGQLAAGIAHEINTPVQYIGDNTSFVLDAFRDMEGIVKACLELRDEAENEAVREQCIRKLIERIQAADLEYLFDEVPKALRETLDGVKRVAHIVLAMKEFAHPGGGTKQAVDLNRAVQNAVTVARNEWKYAADVDLQLDPSVPKVMCFPDDMNQVILNLIVNAAHAIAEKVGLNPDSRGVITVSTRVCGEWFELRVADTGTGIPEAIRSRIFDPFFTTKPVGKGTGQGLAIVHAVVVQKHGGTIQVESEVGKGSEFIVRIPCQSTSGESGGDVP